LRTWSHNYNNYSMLKKQCLLLSMLKTVVLLNMFVESKIIILYLLYYFFQDSLKNRKFEPFI